MGVQRCHRGNVGDGEVENAMDSNRYLSQPGQSTAANAPEERLLGIAERAENICTIIGSGHK